MPNCSWWLAGAIAVATCSLPAHAQSYTYAFHGTVDEISDPAGVFGSVGSGTSFVLTYLADFSNGYRGGGGGGFGGGNWVFGGSSYEPDPYLPRLQFSPVSAVLEINGHALDFSGQDYGAVEYFYNALNEPYGGFGESTANFVAETRAADGTTLLNGISTSLHSPDSASTFYGSIDTPVTLAVDGLSIVGTTSFSYVWGLGTPQQLTISGSLTPTSYSVAAAVPEPSTWLLLVLGLGAVTARRMGIGGALRDETEP